MASTTGDETVVVKPPVKTVGHWLLLGFVAVFVSLPWIDFYFTGEFSGRLGCFAVLTVCMILMLIAAVLGGGNGAVADDNKLILEDFWRPSQTKEISWSQIRSLSVEIDRERRSEKRKILLKAKLDDMERWISLQCPYSEPLLRAIVFRAQLELVESPENWQANLRKKDHQFAAIKQISQRFAHFLCDIIRGPKIELPQRSIGTKTASQGIYEPFDAIERLTKEKKQQWVWTRS